MKFTSTLALGLLFIATSQAAIQVKGSLTLNGVTEVIEQTTEYGQEIVLNDAVSMTITECQDGICFHVDMKVVDGQEVQTLRSPAFPAQLNEEAVITCGDTLQINVTVEQI